MSISRLLPEQQKQQQKHLQPSEINVIEKCVYPGHPHAIYSDRQVFVVLHYIRSTEYN